MKIGKTSFLGLLAIIVAAMIYLFLNYVYPWRASGKNNVLTCVSNMNVNLSDGVSSGPIINGVLYVNAKWDGTGFLELSGIVKWQGETYPVSKRIEITHDIKRISVSNLVTIHAVSSVSLEHDRSPQGVIEKYFIGDPTLPPRIVTFKRVFDNGYLISNLNSPVMLCIDR